MEVFFCMFHWGVGDVNTRRMSLVSVTLLCDSNTDENRFDKKNYMKGEKSYFFLRSLFLFLIAFCFLLSPGGNGFFSKIKKT